jgi:hypothetical protein
MNVSRPLSMLALVALMGCATSQAPVLGPNATVETSSQLVRVSSRVKSGLQNVASHFADVNRASATGILANGEFNPIMHKVYLDRAIKEADLNADGFVSYTEGRAYVEMVLSLGHSLSFKLPLEGCYMDYRRELKKAKKGFEDAPRDCAWAVDDLDNSTYKGCVSSQDARSRGVLRNASRELRICVSNKGKGK